jgi:hypothetical protein
MWWYRRHCQSAQVGQPTAWVPDRRHPWLPARCYLSNSEETAAAVKASDYSSAPWPPLATRSLGSERGVTAGGFQSASAARELLLQAATCSRAVRGAGGRMKAKRKRTLLQLLAAVT